MFTALRLLVNLSFDAELQTQMVRLQFIPKLVDLLPNDTIRNVVLKLLYHLSMRDRHKIMFANTDCVAMVTFVTPALIFSS
jgi:hypothetical protein